MVFGLDFSLSRGRRLSCGVVRSAVAIAAALAAAGAGYCVNVECSPRDVACTPALALLRPDRSAAGTHQFFSRFVFSVTSGDNLIRAFSLDESTGTLTQVSSLGTAPANSTLAMSRHPTLPILVFPENAPADGIHSVRFDATTGALSSGTSQATGNSNSHRAYVMPSGTQVLFNSVQAGNTKYYYGTIDSAGNIGAPGAPRDSSLPANCQAMSLHPTGNFFYTDGCPGGGIQRFSIDGAGNVANLGNTVYNGANSLGRAAFDAAGRMYVNSNTGNVVSFSVDPSTGALGVISNIATGNGGSNHLVVHTSQSRLYAIFPAQGDIQEYAIALDGTLSLVRTASVIPIGLQYERSCMDAAGRFIFVGRFNAAGTIITVRIADDGTLSAGPSVASGNTVTECVTSHDQR